MGILVLEPCQICFLHLPTDSQFLLVLLVTVTVHTDTRGRKKTLMCKDKAKELLKDYEIKYYLPSNP